MLWLPHTRPDRAMTIRRAQADDAREIARVYVDSWRETYRGPLPESYLAGLSYETFERHWRRTFLSRGWAFVAQVDGRVVGVASGGRSRQRQLAEGEVFVLYVLRAYQGRGIGRALFDACRFELAVRGLASTVVWVLAANPARGFYEHLGGIPMAENELQVAGIRVREVAYVWRD